MKWLDASEIVLGYILNGKLLAEHVDARMFAPPYDVAVKLLKEGADLSELYDKAGLAPVMAATEAVQTLGDKSPAEFIKVLEKSWAREELADILDRQSKRLRRGDEADMMALEAAIEANLNLEHRYETSDNIKPSGGKWLKTGYAPLDRHVGGLPEASLTVVAATTGIGKSTFLVQLANSVALEGKKVLIYTLEMTSGQVVKRLLEIQGGAQNPNIIICDDLMGVDELTAEASRLCAVEDIGFIGVDFADLLLSSEEDEPKVAHIYRSLAHLAKRTGTSVVCIAQLHRYEGGEPHIHNIRWSGMAEQVAALIALLYNPAQTFGIGAKKDGQLPVIPGKAWIIIGKSRFGFKEGGVGAIQVDWDSKMGWGTDESSWRSMVM
jgi:replicative DNA helicase